MSFLNLTVRLLLVSVGVFLYGCVAKPPESSIGLMSGETPGSWSATKQAKAGVDSDWVKRFGDRRLTAIVNEARPYGDQHTIIAEKTTQEIKVDAVYDAVQHYIKKQTTINEVSV